MADVVGEVFLVECTVALLVLKTLVAGEAAYHPTNPIEVKVDVAVTRTAHSVPLVSNKNLSCRKSHVVFQYRRVAKTNKNPPLLTNNPAARGIK